MIAKWYDSKGENSLHIGEVGTRCDLEIWTESMGGDRTAVIVLDEYDLEQMVDLLSRRLEVVKIRNSGEEY